MMIYKYCTVETAKQIITSKKLKFTNPDNFNDPFDCDTDTVNFDFTGEKHPIVKYEIDQMVEKKMAGDFFPDEFVRETLNKPELLSELYKTSNQNKVKASSISCFSLKPDIIQMWAYYGQQHEGICLGFDLACDNIFNGMQDEELSIFEVNYKNYLEEKFNYADDPEAGIKIILSTKDISWSHEEEIRILLLKQEGFYEFNSSFLKTIHFGCRVDDFTRDGFIYASKKQLGFNLEYFKLIKGSLQLTEEKIATLK